MTRKNTEHGGSRTRASVVIGKNSRMRLKGKIKRKMPVACSITEEDTTGYPKRVSS